MSESMMNQHGFVPAKSNASLQEGKSTSSLYNASANKGITQSGTYEDFVDVVLIFLPKYEKEFIQSVRVVRNSQGDIDLCDLIQSLKGLAFPVARNVISYFSYSTDMYVYCGNDPIAQGSVIPAEDVSSGEDGKQVTIRVRQVLNSTIANLEPIPEGDAVKLEGSVNFAEGGNSSKQKRTKERKIGEILDKVLQWRRLYTGVNDPATGQTIKMSLEDAAQRVGISKKSLDDYLLQIRFGKKYGFNFNDHFNERVGVLRTFVKKHKGKKDEKIEDGDDDGDAFGDIETHKGVKSEPMSKKSKKI